ncbi:hypothetical protein [Sorangium sp. So ce117]
MNHRRGVLLAVFACGCSIADSSVRDELRDRIAAMPFDPTGGQSGDWL